MKINFRNFRKGLLTGDAGTGKTHVILAIGNLLLEQNDPHPIVYIAEYPHNMRIEKHFKGNETILNHWCNSLMKKLELSFCQHGKPLKIVTDNAPNLRSVEIKDFCSAHGIRHRKIGPYWPKANGHIERFYRTLGKSLKIFQQERLPLNYLHHH